MTHVSRIQKPLPAMATTIDFAALAILFNTLFNVLGFFSGLVTTFFNFAINIGLFLVSEFA